ncbi:hypothetical protein LINPERHAP2_LOCUS21791 [Linum perenne]
MLVCSSEMEVKRILDLKRWIFKEWSILLDIWTKMAGRSNLVLDSDYLWISVRGIPLHIRSMELFRQIGEMCGGFVSAEEGLSMSSIRLKVKAGSLIPDELPLCHGSDVFPVRIEAEAPSSISPQGMLSSFLDSWKGKSSGFLARTKPASISDNTPSTSAASPFCTEPQMGATVGMPDNSLVCNAEADIGAGRALLRNSESVLTQKEDDIDMDFPHPCTLSRGAHLPFVGLSLNKEENICLVSSFSSQNLSSWFKKLDRLSGRSHPGPQNFFGLSLDFGGLHLRSKAQKSHLTVDLLPFRDSTLALGNSDPPSPLDDSGSPTVSDFLTPDSSQGLETSIEISSPSLLESAVREVASIIGLELNGSLAEGKEAAIQVCKSVSSRRAPVIPRSRTERELRKLGVPFPPNLNLAPSPRRDRSGSTSSPTNVI